MIDYANNILRLRSFEIEMNAGSKKDDQRDFALLIKTKTEEECTLDDIINNAKNRNPSLGNIIGYTHYINLNDKTPFFRKEFALPNKLKDKTVAHLEKLESQGIIRKSNSVFASPAYPKEKPNGDIRLLIDYRQLNKQTIVEPFPIIGIFEFYLI